MEEKKARLSEVFVVFCFLAFLFGAMAVTVIREKVDYSYFENRMLAALPEYTAQGDGDGSYVNQWEKYLADHAALRNTLLKVGTRLDLALRRPVVNEVVMGDQILLPYLPPEHLDEQEIGVQAAAMADNLKRISDVVTSYGGYYCYVHVPCQYAYFPERYPDFLNNREELTRVTVEALARELEVRGVSFIDVAAGYRELGKPDRFSSLVDNHYSIYGAFAAYQMVLDRVVEETGLDIPILREGDVTFEKLPNRYLGSRERKLLSLVNLGESLYLLWPKEEVSFTRSDNGNESSPAVYTMPGSKWDVMSYGMYMGNDIAETRIDTNREELPSVLIYGDSFTNAMECILYLSFDKMYSLDLRQYHDMSLTDYIELVKPDVVMCIRDSEVLLELYSNGGAEP